MSHRPYSIAFVLTSFEVGGTERQMVELIRRLDRTEFEVHVACFHRGGPLQTRATENVASVGEFPIEGFGRPSIARHALAFARWCRRIDARIVHTCDLYANIFGLPTSALARVDVRIGNRRELATPDKTRAQLAVQRLAYRAAHAVVANSTAAADQLRREGVPPRKIQMIANGVDCSIFSPNSRPAAGSRRRVVTVANLRPEKGHDTLLAAAPLVAKEHPDVEFVIVGDGVLRESLMRQAQTAGLADRVTFMGERDDVPALLSSSDVFVLPSRSEACPNSVLEAMASALPVVATRIGGIPELVTHGTTGLLVEPNRPEALAAAVLELMSQPERARALGRAARDVAERQFSFARMVSTFERLYLSELTRRATSPEPGRELAAS